MAFRSLAFLLATTTTTFLLVFVFLSTVVGAFGNVADLCQQSSYPVLCKSTIRGSLDAPDATKASIQATIRQTQIAKSMANEQIGSQDDNKLDVDVCLELYDDAISNLSTSMENLKDNQIDDLKINLSAAMSDCDFCEDGTSPLVKANELLYQLTSNCLVLADELKS